MWWFVALAFAADLAEIGLQLQAIQADNHLPILVGTPERQLARDLATLDRTRSDLDLVIVHAPDIFSVDLALDRRGMRCGAFVSYDGVIARGPCGDWEPPPKPPRVMGTWYGGRYDVVDGVGLPRYGDSYTGAVRVARTGLALSIAAPLVPLLTAGVGCGVDTRFGCVIGLAIGSTPGIAMAAIGPPMLAFGARAATRRLQALGMDIDGSRAQIAVSFLIVTWGGVGLSLVAPAFGLPVATIGYLVTVGLGAGQLKVLKRTGFVVMPLVGPDIRGIRYAVAF